MVTTVERAKGSVVTAREAEVLALLARHLTNRQIADALCISVRTAECHVAALLRKLHCRDRRSLAPHADLVAGTAWKSGATIERLVASHVAPSAGRGLRAPRTRYADTGGHSIAYQVVGDGSPDIVFVPGFVSNVDLQWEHAGTAAFFERLADLGRLIVFDKRATGLSERSPLDALPTLEERMDDVRAVMDAAGSSRATIFGISEGGPMAILFAATYPERVERLVIYGSFASDPFSERFDWFHTAVRQSWGSGAAFAHLAPSWATNKATRRFLARYERHSATPAAAAGLVALAQVIDVSAALAGVTAPTLILHRRDDQVISFDRGEALARGIEGAELVEMPGMDHLVYVDGEGVVEHVAAFLAGVASAPVTARVLTTILLIDVVDSTGRAFALGDEQWSKLLRAFVDSSHRAVVQQRGVVRTVAGDGLMATFDGPARAVRCADRLHQLARTCDLDVRCGIHTSEVEIEGDEVTGIGVHVAARVGTAALPGSTFVTRTVRDLVTGSGLRFEPRGSFDFKGINETWELYAAAT